MKLSAGQRAALFRGEAPPKITFPGTQPCPVEVGHVEVLSPHVRFTVTEIRRTRKGEWTLIYELHNNRIGQRYLAVQQGQVEPEQYTHSGGSAVDLEAGEAVDQVTQKRLTREARANGRTALEKRLATIELMRAFLDRQMRDDPDLAREIGRELWQIRGRFDAAKQKLERRVAA